MPTRMTPPSTCARLPSSSPNCLPSMEPTIQQRKVTTPMKAAAETDVDLHDREPDPDGERVDARGHRLHGEDLEGEEMVGGAALGMAQLTDAVEDHLPPDEPEQQKSDPVVGGGDRVAEGPPGEIADDRHEHLEEAEGKGGGRRLLPAEAPVAHAVGDGYREGVHRQPQRDQKKCRRSHRKNPPCHVVTVTRMRSRPGARGRPRTERGFRGGAPAPAKRKTHGHGSSGPSMSLVLSGKPGREAIMLTCHAPECAQTTPPCGNLSPV